MTSGFNSNPKTNVNGFTNNYSLLLNKPIEIKKRVKAETPFVNQIPCWFGPSHMTVPLTRELQQPALNYRSTVYVQSQALLSARLDVTEILPECGKYQVHVDARNNVDGKHISNYGIRYTRRLPNETAVHYFSDDPKIELTQWFSRYYLLFSSLKDEHQSQLQQVVLEGIDVSNKEKFKGTVDIPSTIKIVSVEKKWLLAQNEKDLYVISLPAVKLIGCRQLPKYADCSKYSRDMLATTDNYVLYWKADENSLMVFPSSKFRNSTGEIDFTPLLRITKLKPKRTKVMNIQASEKFIAVTLSEDETNKTFLVLYNTSNKSVRMFMHDYSKGSIPKSIDDTFRSFTLAAGSYELECPGCYWIINGRGEVIHLTQSVVETITRSYKVRGRIGAVSYDTQYIR